MRVIAELSLIPIDVGTSLSPYIAACQRVLAEAGLETELHANGTNISGDWDAVTAAVRRCHEAVHEMGAARVTSTVKLSTRTDRESDAGAMVESVRSKL
jgi:uncharacterized protein (TIGR00106 family)